MAQDVLSLSSHPVPWIRLGEGRMPCSRLVLGDSLGDGLGDSLGGIS